MCTSAEGKNIEIDARTSDAIAIAVRFDCPINTFEFILAQAGILLDDNTIDSINEKVEVDKPIEETDPVGLTKKSIEELNQMLDDSLQNEAYELASKIRDELNNRKKS
jgi:hypothetical protein